MRLLLVILIMAQTLNSRGQADAHLLAFKHNKEIPASLEQNVLKALSFFPELKETRISFILKSNIKSSVMQAQPVFRTILGRRSKRRYRININQHFKLLHTDIPIHEIPNDVMVGWIGHELGHILDYESMSNTEMISFGYNYYFSEVFVRHAEMVADSLAVERGMGNYIVETKRFILNHADLPQAYKDKISRLYLSPDIIVEQVRMLEEQQEKQNAH